MQDVVITGIGLVSSLADGARDHYLRLNEAVGPVHDTDCLAPFPVHPLVSVDYDRFIPKKSDQRQMGPWQRLGVHAAGLALEDAGLLGDQSILPKVHMTVAAGSGERDIEVDEAIMNGRRAASDPDAFLNEQLSTNLRPTLFLAQLPNLLAGNISITHGVAGSSRTFMGEEGAGLSALAMTVARIGAGDIDVGLVGAACSAPRQDMALSFGFGGSLWWGDPAGVWSRAGQGGGFIMGSMGAFLVLESRSHARSRGARISGVVGPVLSDRSNRATATMGATIRRQWGQMEAALAPGAIGILSGATGVEPVTSEERLWLEEVGRTRPLAVRATGTMLGHGIEATAVMNVGLAATALREGGFFQPFEAEAEKPIAGEPPSDIVVTSVGHWRGEGLILVRRETGTEA